MKNTFSTLLLLLSLASFSQSLPQSPVLPTPQQPTIIPLYNTGHTYGSIQGAYYKDVDKFQDQFVGNWLYTNGTTTLKVTFRKRVKAQRIVSAIKYYEDYLVGEYQYIENGTTKVNTLPNISKDYSSKYQHTLYSITKAAPYSSPACPDCKDNEYRLRMEFHEPSDKGIVRPVAEFVIRCVVENGVVKIKAQFVQTAVAIPFNFDGTPATIKKFSLPYGDYTLIKQP